MAPTKLFDPSLAERDPEIARLITAEEVRETVKLRLIPSENYASRAVLEATGSILTNKYSEGYAGKRYYEGQQIIDQVEELAVSRLKALFGAEHVNVQPYSGSPANLAAYLAFCNAGDTIMGLGLPSGGHLTHGSHVSITGRYFKAIGYNVSQGDQRIDFAEVRALAKEHKPKLLWCGTTAYPRQLDFAKFREIADVITSTTHKTLRGPRGGIVMCKAEHAKDIDRAVFPGLRGGPPNHTPASIAVAELDPMGQAHGHDPDVLREKAEETLTAFTRG